MSSLAFCHKDIAERPLRVPIFDIYSSPNLLIRSFSSLTVILAASNSGSLFNNVVCTSSVKILLISCPSVKFE